MREYKYTKIDPVSLYNNFLNSDTISSTELIVSAIDDQSSTIIAEIIKKNKIEKLKVSIELSKEQWDKIIPAIKQSTTLKELRFADGVEKKYKSLYCYKVATIPWGSPLQYLKLASSKKASKIEEIYSANNLHAGSIINDTEDLSKNKRIIQIIKKRKTSDKIPVSGKDYFIPYILGLSCKTYRYTKPAKTNSCCMAM